MTRGRKASEVGAEKRAWLRKHVIPKLYVGAKIPSASFLGRLLGLGGSQAGSHMHRVLLEDGYKTELRGTGKGQRHYVVALPSGEAQP